MIAKFNITGSIEVNLPEEIIEQVNKQHSEIMKKHVLEEYFYNILLGCSSAAHNELNYVVDFDNVEIENDWNKYTGTICYLNKNEHGSPLAIWLDNYPTTQQEIIENTMNEIGNRKKIKKIRTL